MSPPIYTIFVVNSRDRFGFANFYIAGDTCGTNRNLVLGYEQVGLLRRAHFSNDLDAFVAPYVGTLIWSLDTFRFAQTEGRDIYHDGTHVAADDNSIPFGIQHRIYTRSLPHLREFFWFQGDLAEIVVYKRALTSDERLCVEVE